MVNPHSHRTNDNPIRLGREQMDARSQHLRKGSGAASPCAYARANSRRTPDFPRVVGGCGETDIDGLKFSLNVQTMSQHHHEFSRV